MTALLCSLCQRCCILTSCNVELWSCSLYSAIVHLWRRSTRVHLLREYIDDIVNRWAEFTTYS